MSNQVYSNLQNKYLPQPGINGYELPSSIQVVANPGIPVPVNLEFNTIKLEEVPGLVDLSVPGEISVLSRGLYSFTYTIACQYDSPTAETADIFATLVVADTGTGWDDVSIASAGLREEARGVSLGSDNRYLTLSYVGYLPQGGSLKVLFTNYAPAQLTMLSTISRVIVSKLA